MDLVLEAKRELSKQLNDVMVTFLYTGIRSIWASSRESYEINKKTKETGVLKIFQEKLSMIPKWNQNIINSEYTRLLTQSEKIEPEFFDKLIEALFISHIQVLASIRMNSKNNKLNVKIPNSKNFVHKCYIECARRFYVEPSLFEDRRNRCSFVSIQKNLSICYKIIIDCIEKTVRNTLPIRSILEEALLASESEPEDTEPVDTDSEEEPENVEPEEELEKVVPEEELEKVGPEEELEKVEPEEEQEEQEEHEEHEKNGFMSDTLKNELDVIKGDSLKSSLNWRNNEEIEIFFNEIEEPVTEPIEDLFNAEREEPIEDLFNAEREVSKKDLSGVEILERIDERRTYTPPMEKSEIRELSKEEDVTGFFSDADSE
jgi:hypothetical protein